MTTIDRFQGDYRWLSNFASAEVELDGVFYPTTEHAYQAAKSLELDVREKIRLASTPGKARRMGQKVKPLRQDWEEVKLPVMEDLNRQKFSKPFYKQLLLFTDSRFLLEGNTWHDNFWGDCVCGEGVCLKEGKNNLGKILMKIRDELRNNE